MMRDQLISLFECWMIHWKLSSDLFIWNNVINRKMFSRSILNYSILFLFLSGSHNIYFGRLLCVLPYFGWNGFKCEEYDNPTYFILDVLIQSNNRSSNKLENPYLHSTTHSNLCQMITNQNKVNYLLKNDKFPRYKSEFYYVA